MILPNSQNSVMVDFSGWSRTGTVRMSNADEFLIAGGRDTYAWRRSMLPRGPVSGRDAAGSHLFLVADGIGNGLGGQRASQIVANQLTRYALEHLGGRWKSEADRAATAEELVESLQQCQQQMECEAVDGRERQKMGTTVTLGCLLWPTLHVIHAGDSRCYLMRDRKLQQLTKDHTMAQQLTDAHILDPNVAIHSRWQNMLWNAVSSEDAHWKPDLLSRTLQPGDTVLFCTDGLNKHVSDERIEQILQHERRASELTRMLVNHALADGGSDNVTAVVARFSG